MEGTGALFRKAFNGYNKDDVNKFIEEMSLRTKKRDDLYEAEIIELREELDLANEQANTAMEQDFSVKTAAFESKIAALEAELNHVKQALDEKEKECEGLRSDDLISVKEAEISKLKSDMSALEEKYKGDVSALELKLEKTSGELAAANSTIAGNAETMEKARMYDSVSARIGEVMMSAGEAGDKLLAEAKTKSEGIVSDAIEQKSRVMKLLRDYSEKYCERLARIAFEEAENKRNEISRELSEFSEKLAGINMQISTNANTLDEYIGVLRREIDNKLDAAIDTHVNSDLDFDGKRELDDVFCAEIEKILSGADQEGSAE